MQLNASGSYTFTFLGISILFLCLMGCESPQPVSVSTPPEQDFQLDAGPGSLDASDGLLQTDAGTVDMEMVNGKLMILEFCFHRDQHQENGEFHLQLYGIELVILEHIILSNM